MQRLNELLGTYNHLFITLKQQTSEAEKEQTIHLNEAFFILCWGVVDNYIDSFARKLILIKQASPSWDVRRGFLIYNVSDKKLSGLSLEEKVDLLINKDTDLLLYKKIKRLYKLRNHIAHGKEYSQLVDLSEFDGILDNLNKAITL